MTDYQNKKNEIIDFFLLTLKSKDEHRIGIDLIEWEKDLWGMEWKLTIAIGQF